MHVDLTLARRMLHDENELKADLCTTITIGQQYCEENMPSCPSKQWYVHESVNASREKTTDLIAEPTRLR